jgi:hypothetical protein
MRQKLDDLSASELRARYEIESDDADSRLADENADAFVRRLENVASAAPQLAGAALLPQRERKRKADKLAGSLFDAHETLAALDENARGWILANLRSEFAGGRPEDAHPAQAQIVAQILQADVLGVLQRASLAVQRAAKSMPEPERITRPELFAALGVIRTFEDHFLVPDTSETGFAAYCLRAVLHLMGHTEESKRVAYWLEQAQENPDRLP